MRINWIIYLLEESEVIVDKICIIFIFNFIEVANMYILPLVKYYIRYCIFFAYDNTFVLLY
ncbi:hypothetical protein D5039_21510 [Verminephrobacter aporrectodeae subsp. tuberculatae]|uniref:Uncharacterized protein n=1 Tax=Verminephrobacter aporrectodeae subsp. tuberculatae TaxID=1110392 RepID=A0ABT3L0B9_9BURK|nr:hypothetical protein [Verminephrobacter aporrectodeae subsp. tuberculatae]